MRRHVLINKMTYICDNWVRLERFLILGSEGGSYSAAGRPLTIEKTKAVRLALAEDGPRVVDVTVQISTSGRAAKNDAALYVLALASSPKFADAESNAAALKALPQVARTGAHLCTYAAFVRNLRGWGRGLRSAIANWYEEKPVRDLARQMLKHRRRKGWTHRDLLRLAHPKAGTPDANALFHWAVNGKLDGATAPAIMTGSLRQVYAFEQAKKARDESEVVRLIEDYRLSHEMVPGKWMNSAAVWEALLDGMPYQSLMRNAGRMTAVGLAAPESLSTAWMVARLVDRSRIRRSEVHPVQVLSALSAYKTGCRGNVRWSPMAAVADALTEAFDAAFDNVKPAGRRLYVGVESNSASGRQRCAGTPQLTAPAAAALIAMVAARTEPDCTVVSFDDAIRAVETAGNDVETIANALAFGAGGADASVPIEDARTRRIPVDAFLIVTGDGSPYPVEALRRYRGEMGIAAKLIMMAPASAKMPDAEDSLQLNIAGFDSAVPGVISRFLAAG